MTLFKESHQLIETYFDRLWPILRSITGEGVRQSHDILGELVPLERLEIPSGTQVFDWTIPKEWRVREAYVLDPNGQRILDVQENNLHLLNYSKPFRGTLSLAELNEHLYSLPDKPTAIPYLTTYYKARWGFCLSQEQRSALPEGKYEVVVDTELFDGSLTIGEAVLQGESDDEVFISTYTCHPSLANNELSGPLVAAFLYKRLAALEQRHFTYRFVFLPETIGAIAYLHLRGEHLKAQVKAGYVITCIGDDAPFTFKHSRLGASLADLAAEQVLKESGVEHSVLPYSPMGSDERQYCSPGFNLPVASLMRTMYGTYSEYHTSLDNKDFISFEALQGSVDMYEQVCLKLERDHEILSQLSSVHLSDNTHLEAESSNASIRYLNLFPKGEPRLDKHGLYDSLGQGSVPDLTQKVLWLLNYSDGEHSLGSISALSGFSVEGLHEAAQACLKADLLKLLS